MEKTMEYEEPKLLELDALPMRGDDPVWEDASTAEFTASYDGDDAEHEIVEF